MKCEQITSVYYTSGTDRKENKIICGGEMMEVGRWIAVIDYKLYQCNSCKTVKLI